MRVENTLLSTTMARSGWRELNTEPVNTACSKQYELIDVFLNHALAL